MLSDEEREALQYFNTETKTEAMHYGAVLVKLIEKKSKEIEELKKYKEGYKLLSYSLDNYTSKDKIKSKIEEYKKQQKEEPDAYLCIKVLQSLLEKE